MDTACSTYLDNYGSPTVIALVHSPERGALTIAQAPKSLFPAPLSGYLSCKSNFPAVSGLLPLLSSELAGVGSHLQGQRLLAVGSTTPGYNALTQGRVGGRRFQADRHVCSGTVVSRGLVECFEGFLKCLLPQTVSCELIPDSLDGGRGWMG